MTSKESLEEMFWPTGTVLPGLAKRAVLVTNIASPEVQSKARSNVLKETRPVIIDIGTGSCKIGYAGDPQPSFVVSSTVVKPFREKRESKTGGIQKEYLIGKEKEFFPNIAQKLVNPLWHGVIVDWDCIEAMFEYLFVQEMKITPDEHAVLLSDPPLSPITNREKYIEMMFETFNVPAFHMAYQPRLAMYSYGRTSSLVVECGHGVSYAVPISEGHVLTSLTGRVDYGGADVTKCLMENLNGTGHKFNVEHLDIIEDIKNKFCYLSLDFNNEISLPQNTFLAEYKLPDGQQIIIGKERFICPEVLFWPSLMGSPQPGLQDLTMTCIKNCDASLQKSMLNNILLSGGSTMLEGFPARFQEELNRFSGHQKPCVLASPERQFSTWRGGSVLASLRSFQQVWLYRKEYEEHGPSIVYRRCF